MVEPIHPREDNDEERDVDKAVPRGDVSEIRDPELIRPRRDEKAIDQVDRVLGRRIGLGLPLDALNDRLSHLVADGRRGPFRWVALRGFPPEVCRRGDQHHAADWFDPIRRAVLVDEHDHHSKFPG